MTRQTNSFRPEILVKDVISWAGRPRELQTVSQACASCGSFRFCQEALALINGLIAASAASATLAVLLCITSAMRASPVSALVATAQLAQGVHHAHCAGAESLPTYFFSYFNFTTTMPCVQSSPSRMRQSFAECSGPVTA